MVAPCPTENISGRLRKCLSVWRDIGASRWVQDVLYFGYKLPFIQLPKPAVFENHTACNKHRSYVDKAIAELVVCGAAEKVENEAAHVISPLGVVEGRKLRLILDLRFVNKHLAKCRFRCDGLDCFTEMYKETGLFSLTLTVLIITLTYGLLIESFLGSGGNVQFICSSHCHLAYQQLRIVFTG